MNAITPGFAGMRLAGAGGGKSGGGGGGVEAPNTLRSDAVVRLIDVLSEGPIYGLAATTYPGQSIYFNDTPLQDANGKMNFEGVSYALRYGTPSQSVVSGYPAVESVTAVGTPVTVLSGPVTQTITNTADTALLFTITVSALYQMDTSSGNMNDFWFGLEIDIMPNGGSFQMAVADSISGKCVAPYQRTYKVPIPAGTAFPLTVRMTRTTPDDPNSASVSAFSWTSITEQIEHQLIYPDTAYAALTVDATAFGGAIPTRSYDVKGIEIQLPANYNPVTRTYATTGIGTSAGSWDGATFQVAWSNNPAWILYDLLTNKRYGLGDVIKTGYVDVWTLYVIGQYCDGLVDNGAGGTEPRYTFNGVINTLADAYRVVQSIASSFAGMTYWGAGQIMVVQDAPANQQKLFTESNVIDGAFTYEGTALNARHSMCAVQWLDPSNAYRPTIELVSDPAMVQLLGVRRKDVTGLGITSRGQAIRFARWVLDTEKHGTEMVSFKAGIHDCDVRPGMVVAVQDAHYAGIRNGGRTVAPPAANAVARSNLIANGDATGAIGPTNTLPTNWTNPNSGGALVQVIGTGIQDSGLGFVDLKVSGAVGVFPWSFYEDLMMATALSPSLTFARSTVGTYFDQNGITQTAAVNGPRFDHAYGLASAILPNSPASYANASALPAGFNLVSAAGATYIGADGSMHMAAANVPRFDYTTGSPVLLAEAADTNYVPDSQTFAGAIANGTLTANTGATPIGAGIGYVQCVASTSGTTAFMVENAPALVAGQTYVVSCWVMIPAQAAAITSLQFLNTGGGGLPATTQPVVGKTGWQFIKSAPVVWGTSNQFYLYGTASAVGAIMFITAAQISAYGGSYIPTTGTVASRSADMATQAQGLLVEPPSTNYVYNSSMVGSISGTPGTSPTNWSVSKYNSLSSAIAGSGVENGIPYVDFRIYGTPTGSGVGAYIFTGSSTGGISVPCTAGVSYVQSGYARVSAGSLANLSISQVTNFYNSGNSFVSLVNPAMNSRVGGVSLGASRFQNAGTAPASTAYIANTAIEFSVTSGQPVDCTLRIGGVQLEIGVSVASSFIPTPAGAKASRGSDSFSATPAALGLTAASGLTAVMEAQLAVVSSGAATSASLNFTGGSGSFSVSANSGLSPVVIGYTETAPAPIVQSGNVITFNSTTPGGNDFAGFEQIMLDYMTVTGNFTVTAQVAFTGTPGANSGVGIAVLDSIAYNGCTSIHALSVLSGANSLVASWADFAPFVNPDQGSSTAGGPSNYVKIQRVGNVVTLYGSTNGTTWTTLATLSPASLPATLYIGAAFVANGTACGGTVANFSVTPASTSTGPGYISGTGSGNISALTGTPVRIAAAFTVAGANGALSANGSTVIVGSATGATGALTAISLTQGSGPQWLRKIAIYPTARPNTDLKNLSALAFNLLSEVTNVGLSGVYGQPNADILIDTAVIQALAVSPSTAYVGSAYLKLMYGSYAGLTALEVHAQASHLSGPTLVLDADTASVDMRGQTLTAYARGQATVTSGAASTLGNTRIRMAATAGAALNFVLRVGGGQFETGTVASSYLSTSGTPTTVYGPSTTVIALDGPVTLSAGFTYTLLITDMSGNVQSSTVSNAAGTYSILNLTAPLSSAPPAGSVWILTSAQVAPRPFRVLSVSEVQKNTYEVTALLYDPNKYNRVDFNIQSKDVNYSDLLPAPSAAIPAPLQVIALEYVSGVGTTTLDTVTVSWSIKPDARVTGYEFQVLAADGTTVLQDLYPTGLSIDLTSLTIKSYFFRVRALTITTAFSAWTTSALFAVTGTTTAPSGTSAMTCQPIFNANALTWANPPDRLLKWIELWRSTDNVLAHASLIQTVTAAAYTDTGLNNLVTYYYWTRVVDTTGASSYFTGPVSGRPVQIAGADMGANILTIQTFVAGLSAIGVWTGASLPANPAAANNATVIVWQNDFQLYRWNSTTSTWTTTVNTTSLVGTIPGSSVSGVISGATLPGSAITGSLTVATLPAASITGTLAAAQIASLAATQITGTLTAAQIASVTAAAIAGTIAASQVAAIPSTQISGTLTAAQIASVAASTVTGTLTSAQIASVTAASITGTIAAAQIASIPATQISGTLAAAQIASLTAAQITGTLTAAQIASITAAQLTGTIVSTQIGANAVTTAAIAANAVTAAQIAANTITASQIAANTITATQILAGTITTAQIAAGTIVTSNIASATITGGNIAGLTITAGNLVANTITAAQIAAGTITSTQIAASTIVAGNIASGTITATQILAGTITTAQIAAGTIQASNIASATITGGNIAGLTITAGNLVANTITAAQILAGTITATQIAAGTITATQIAAGTITATQILAGTITTAQIAAGTIQASNIAANTITAGQIAANAIGTAQLTVGFGTNVISNPSLQVSIFGWQTAITGSPAGYALNQASSTGFYSPAEGAGALTAVSLPTSATVSAVWSPVGGALGIACIPGTYLEAQAKLGANRCCARVQMSFYTTGGTLISTVSGNRVVAGSTAALSSFVVSSVIAVVPATAATVQMTVEAYNDGGSDFSGVGTGSLAAGNNIYVWFCQASLGLTVAGATQIMPYTPGGVTSINGGSIAANSITANQIAAGTITATQILAGTITTTQLAAGTLTASNITSGTLSSGVIIGSLASFGTVQITNAQIQNLSVVTSNIANSAITNTGVVSAYYGTGSGVYSANLSVSVTVPLGSYVILTATCSGKGGTPTVDGSFEDTMYISMSRSGATLSGTAPVPVAALASVIQSASGYELPGAGSFTYTVTGVLANNSESGSSSNGLISVSLVAQVIKK